MSIHLLSQEAPVNVDLSNGQMKEGDLERICDDLKGSKILNLNLSNNGLTDADIKTLSRALAQCSTLQSTNLAGNYLTTLSGYFIWKSLGPDRSKLVDLGLLTYESIYNDAKTRLLFQNIPAERTDELLSKDPMQEGLRALCKDFTARRKLLLPPEFAKHEEYTQRTIRRVLFLDFLDQHPDVRKVPVLPPVVITGLFRTGSTLLFNLMSACEGSRAPKLWEIYHPTPPPALEEVHTDERIQRTKDTLELWKRNGFQFDNAHELRAEFPEECMFIMREENFYTEAFLNKSLSPETAYYTWYQRQSLDDIYANTRLFLQAISYRYRPSSHWLLKAPYHLMNIDVLLRTYSDRTKLVLTHRDPITCLASTFSLWCTIAAQEWEGYDPRPAARFMLEYFSQGWERTMEILDEYERDGKSDLVFHVYYTDLVKDPQGMVQRIHQHFGLPSASREKMQRWLDENPSGKHGKHKYDLADYGLTPKDVYTAFYKYYVRFFPELLPANFTPIRASL